MKGDIALAGFVLTADEWEQIDPLSRARLMAEEWQALDPISRTQLMASLMPRKEPWGFVGPSAEVSVVPEGSRPNLRPAELAAYAAQNDNELDLDDVS